MAGYQQLTLIGNAGDDAVLRTLQNGQQVASVSLACSRSWTDGNGERQEVTTWWRLSFWNEQAKNAAKLITKGSQLFVTASSVKPSAYLDKSGSPAASLEATVTFFQMLGARQDASGSKPNNGNSSGDILEDADIPF